MRKSKKTRHFNVFVNNMEFEGMSDDLVIKMSAHRSGPWSGERLLVNAHLSDYQLLDLTEHFRKYMDNKISQANHIKKVFLIKANNQES